MEIRTYLPIIERSSAYASRVAIQDHQGSSRYDELQTRALQIARYLIGDQGDLKGARIAFMITPGFDYVAVLWGIWLAGGIAVPLGLGYPESELSYILSDTHASVLIGDRYTLDQLPRVAAANNTTLLKVNGIPSNCGIDLPGIDVDRSALILYTSGTTSKPKGVVTTHRNITQQVKSLVQAWEWNREDRILNVLPLHHVHGIINVVSCALWSGACCRFLTPFDADLTFEAISEDRLTLFMAVPTIYSKMISVWERASRKGQARFSDACSRMRLMVSGSAALPIQVLEKWHAITGHTLLERYGMTEIGMALSNPLHGERKPGMVGKPLPEVEIQLADNQGKTIRDDLVPGEICVKGPTVFLEYWQKPDATRAAFRDGWFRTGDIAVIEDGYYRILGRDSVDIIKSGGFKISALEIEEVLRTHASVSECSVVGVEDPEWGERVAVAVILEPEESLTLEGLREWAGSRLSKQKIPSLLQIVEDLPRNALGKVIKPEVRSLFGSTRTHV